MNRSVIISCFSDLLLCYQPVYNCMDQKIQLGSFSALLVHGIGWDHLLGCIQVITGLESSRTLHSHVSFFSMMLLSLHRSTYNMDFHCLVIQ